MPTGRPDAIRRHEHTRTNHNSFRDSVTQRHIDVVMGAICPSADIAHRGKSGLNRCPRRRNRIISLSRSGRLQLSQSGRFVVGVVKRDMGVRVHESWREGCIAKVNHLCIGRDRNIRSDIDDLIALNNDDAVLHERARFAVEKPRRFQCDDLIIRAKRERA